jgi:hypothetical protein
MAKVKPKEDRLSAGHHTGRTCGYDVLPDGTIRIAPALADPMRELSARESGLEAMLRGVSAFVAEQMSVTSKARAAWWKEVGDEIGIEIVRGWIFDPSNNTLTPPPKTPPEKSE